MDRTNAERQRRYIQRLKERAAGGVSKAADARIRELEAEIAKLKKGAAKPGGAAAATKPQPAPDAAKDQEIARLKARIAELETTATKQPPSDARLAELEAELARAHDERNKFGKAFWDIRE